MYKAALLFLVSEHGVCFSNNGYIKKHGLAYSYCTFVNTEFLAHKTVECSFFLKVM